MKRNNLLPITKQIYIYTILLLSASLLYSCQDSINSISSGISDGPAIESTTNSPMMGNKAFRKGKLSLNVLNERGTEFKVFDGMGFKGKPDMNQFGIRPIDILYPYELWSTKRNSDNRWEYVSESGAAKAAHKAARLKSRAVMVNIGHWTTERDIETLEKSRHRLLTLYYDLKRAEPNHDFGFFSKLPTKVWWGEPPSQAAVQKWQERNNHLKGLAKRVDVFYLSGYTQSKSRKRWLNNTKQMIQEAKRLNEGKPIYVVLWPQYQPGTPYSYGGNNIEKDFWQLQLETVKEHADGIVLYAPSGRQWDESAPWWEATKEFMEDMGDFSAEPKVSDAEFKVFDGTRFRSKPNMSWLGFTPIKLIFEMQLWEKPMNQVEKWELPSKKLVTEWAEKAKEVNNDIAMINIEHWPNHGPAADVSKTVEKLTTVYDWFKEVQPDMDFGFYNMTPKKLHWRSYPQAQWLSSITDNNDRLAPLANKVDAYFISGYTKKRDQKGWAINTRYNIKQAHKYSEDKPVYLVLWPQYYAPHDQELDDQYIEEDFWQLQLETARQYADGVLIYFPWSVRWSEAYKEPWWNVTLRFLRDMGKRE